MLPKRETPIAAFAVGPVLPLSPQQPRERVYPHLVLPRAWFLCVWATVMTIHVICGLYMIGVAYIYWFFKDPNMIYWAKLFGGTIDNPYYKISGCSFIAVGALHLLKVAQTLWLSLQVRELVFYESNRVTDTMARLSTRLGLQGAIDWSGNGCCQKSTNAAHSLSRSVSTVFGREGLFGVHSKSFSRVFVAREIVEIVSQTYQAYRSCDLIPRPTINNIIMSLLIVNCWSTPILQRLLHRQPTAERVLCLLLDAFLSIGSNYLIPFIIFLPYYRAFDFVNYTFPYALLYNNVRYTRLITETRMILALSFLNLLSKMVNYLSIYSSIVSATEIFQRQAVSVQPARVHIATHVVPIVKGVKTRSARYLILVHGVFVAWGLGLLTVYGRSIGLARKPPLGCMDTTYAWFATKFPCSCFVYSCYVHQVEGPDGHELDHLDRDTLAYLEYAHCPSMTVSQNIKEFPNLLAFQVYNSTIHSWSRENAISAVNHKKMIAVLLTRTNMSVFPDGLLEPLPATLTDIEITTSNLSALPDDLNERWDSLSVFFVEYTNIQEVPDTLFQIPMIVLSLVGNKIRHLPSLDHASVVYYIVDLGKNPLQELPATIGAGVYAVYLDVQDTDISSVPSWVYTNVGLPYGRESPYCDSENTRAPTTNVALGCAESDPRGGGRIPVKLIDERLGL